VYPDGYAPPPASFLPSPALSPVLDVVGGSQYTNARETITIRR
jgi:hypothetical protein